MNAPLKTNAPLREIDDLPGPAGLPLVGNLFQVRATRLHQVLERWRRQHGDYYRFRLGKRRFVVIASASAITTKRRLPRRSRRACATGPTASSAPSG